MLLEKLYLWISNNLFLVYTTETLIAKYSKTKFKIKLAYLHIRMWFAFSVFDVFSILKRFTDFSFQATYLISIVSAWGWLLNRLRVRGLSRITLNENIRVRTAFTKAYNVWNEINLIVFLAVTAFNQAIDSGYSNGINYHLLTQKLIS